MHGETHSSSSSPVPSSEVLNKLSRFNGKKLPQLQASRLWKNTEMADESDLPEMSEFEVGDTEFSPDQPLEPGSHRTDGTESTDDPLTNHLKATASRKQRRLRSPSGWYYKCWLKKILCQKSPCSLHFGRIYMSSVGKGQGSSAQRMTLLRKNRHSGGKVSLDCYSRIAEIFLNGFFCDGRKCSVTVTF
jgi:hypothetical protein